MADKDDTVVEDKAEEPKAEDKAEEPKAEDKAEEPKAEESGSAAAAPAGDEPEATGTDQQGRQLYSVKCSNCGKQTEVPFKPTGDRPVFCRDCYMQKKNG